MIILLLFAFLAGVVTILSPCILPILPIILSSSFGGRGRPFGVVVGFVASFTFFTLLLSTLVRLSGIPADSLRILSVFVIAGFGFALIIPRFQLLIEQMFARLSQFVPQSKSRPGFFGGIIIGLSLGLLWTPCVGPILASVISLALIGQVTLSSALIVLAYSLGTAVVMFAIMLGGRALLARTPWLVKNTGNIQRIFGVVMIGLAIAIFFNLDRNFQTFILDKFPNYGVGLTKFEDNDLIKKELDQIQDSDSEVDMGRPSFEMLEPKGIPAPEIIPGGEWINTDSGFKIQDLRGKVVLVDFWTYSCINCQRTFPYLRDWWEKYKDQGLVIIGVHSPEFEFEKNIDNVRDAAEDFGLTYPIVQDNDFATWRAYGNRYWPAKYFIDKDGFVRYSHFGEGDYDNSEAVIQQLLSEAGARVSQEINNPVYQNYAQTPEIYLGSLRYNGENYVNFEGQWDQEPEYSSPAKGSKLKLNFNAKDVFLVMRPKNGLGLVKVYLDGELQKTITVDGDELYELVKLQVPGNHILELEFGDGNVEVYAFTFG